jgi:hypothetical protein
MRALYISLIFISLHAFSQDKRLHFESTSTWREGLIFHTDGTQLKGWLRFNDQLGTLTFRDEEENEQNLHPNEIAGFQFSEARSDEPVVFQSIEYFTGEEKIHWQFFGLLIEMQDFRVWIKVEPLTPQLIQYQIPSGDPSIYTGSTRAYKKSILKRTETIFFSTNYNNEFHPLVRFESESNMFNIPEDPESDKRPKQDFKPLKEFIGNIKFKALESYAKKEKLNWNKKADLLKILSQIDNL